jgi:hypothetical protein
MQARISAQIAGGIFVAAPRMMAVPPMIANAVVMLAPLR